MHSSGLDGGVIRRLERDKKNEEINVKERKKCPCLLFMLMIDVPISQLNKNLHLLVYLLNSKTVFFNLYQILRLKNVIFQSIKCLLSSGGPFEIILFENIY